MRKYLSVIMVVLFLCSACTVNGNLKPSVETLDKIDQYYSTFIIGVDAAVPWLKVYFPAYATVIDSMLVPIVETAKTALVLYRNTVVLYKAGSVGATEVLAKQQEIFNVLQAVNQIIGQIKGMTNPPL